MTPKELKIRSKAYKQKCQEDFERENLLAYLHGVYFMDSISATVGNMFSGKSSKKIEYPKKPYDLKSKENSEEELQKQRELLLAKLMIMGENFNREKKEKRG